MIRLRSSVSRWERISWFGGALSERASERLSFFTHLSCLHCESRMNKALGVDTSEYVRFLIWLAFGDWWLMTALMGERPASVDDKWRQKKKIKKIENLHVRFWFVILRENCRGVMSFKDCAWKRVIYLEYVLANMPGQPRDLCVSVLYPLDSSSIPWRH